ncbi:beta-ketoacyl synthase chain length factor, partial [Desulfococcus sp.]|uniref:beta-ketoacyl synthase chain length factor n=1 Tax=Desulfococcus sp. TaxID=2025834 RepID=UPI003593651A
VGAAACLTGAGFMGPSLERLGRGEGCAGTLSIEEISRDLPPRLIRRLKRLSRMALSLATSARDAAGRETSPAAVFWGTGWGPLSETHDFLDQLAASRHRFASPTDFVGSLHNAPAGHVAAHFNARGPSITATGGDASFEQALLCASLMAHEIDGPFLVLGADEAHPRFTPLFDPSAALAKHPSDGGGALWVHGMRKDGESGVRVYPAVLAPAEEFRPADMVAALGGPARLRSDFAAVFAGIPAAWREDGAACLKEFLSVSGFDGPVLDFRRQIGEFATASAAAVAVAVEACRRKTILAPPDIPAPLSLESRGILVLGLGACLSAVAVLP